MRGGRYCAPPLPRSMDDGTPSRTALRVALRRAVHQIHDSPLVFNDPVALRILGGSYSDALRQAEIERDGGFATGLRAFLVARSRYAEDKLSEAVEAGVRQYVILGAGLDTFAYRNPYSELRVFEVDHPATQAWKRDLLCKGGIPIPDGMTFVPVDFERQVLKDELRAGRFDFDAPAFFAWLGVVPYLTLEAFRSTVGLVAARPPGSGMVLDYGVPREALSLRERLARDALTARVQQAGEPFRLFFTPGHIATELADFRQIEDLGLADINARYFSGRRDRLSLRGASGRLLCGWR
jgi:methyltransferase (TIGR00027 family)